MEYPEGGILGHFSHNEDKLHGPFVIHHPTGQKMLSGTFRQGKRLGNFITWDSNGIARLYTYHYTRGHIHSYATYCDQEGNVRLITKYMGGGPVQAHLVEKEKVVESFDMKTDFVVSEQLKTAIDAFQAYYQNSKDAERDVADLIKLEVEEARFARSASRAAGVAQQLEAKQRARAASTNALIEGQRRRNGGL